MNEQMDDRMPDSQTTVRQTDRFWEADHTLGV